MPCRPFVLGALAALLAMPSLADAQPGRRGQDSGAEYGWTSDYAAALNTARASGKPLMVVFRCVP